MLATSLIFSFAVVIFSIVIHEVSHGAVANNLGDSTAKNAGRLTLNPLKHIDLVGMILLPALLIFTTGRAFGWAKPVPVNPFNFRDQKYGSLKVASAGPISNLLIALFFGLLIRFALFSNLSFLPTSFYYIVSFIVSINILLAIFNLMPIPPLDGSHILFSLMPDSMRDIKIFLSRFGFFILIFLIFFFSPFSRFLGYAVDSLFTLIVGAPPLI